MGGFAGMGVELHTGADALVRLMPVTEAPGCLVPAFI